VFCNHVLPGGAVGAATGARFAVKAHGSELEYSIRGRADLAEVARKSLEPSAAVFVGSGHITEVLEDVVGPVERVREVPPGVDVEEFVPQPREEALRDLLDECRRDPPNPGNVNERLPDEGNAARLERFLESDKPTVLYFGKLLYNKGVHLLLEALHGLDAKAIVVGFGDYRERLEHLAPPRTLFTGQLDHRHLVHLIPLADAVVVPSIFPEAFGMVAAEAAAAGCPPIVARHSGLTDVAEGLEAAYGERRRELASFTQGDSVELQEKLHDLLALTAAERGELGAAARGVAVERWSWESVAERLLEPFA
jgi:glycosyltransferase involved in cell wall biosynthesis